MPSNKFQLYPADSHSNKNKEEQYLFGVYLRINSCDVVACLMACSVEGGTDRQFGVVRSLHLRTENGFYLDSELCFLTEAELKQLRETGKLSFPDGVHLQIVSPFIDEEEKIEEEAEKEETKDEDEEGEVCDEEQDD